MTSDYVWTPVGASTEELNEFLSLRPGIPDYMRESVIGWVRNRKEGFHGADIRFLLSFQTAAKIHIGIRADDYMNQDSLSKFLRTLQPHVFANLIHYILSEFPPVSSQSASRASELEEILSAGGSSYAVGRVQGRYGLVDRVPAAVAETVEEVISSAGKASSLLSSAWEKAFGMTKNPSHAYSDAVKAVEVLSCPLFSPKDKLGTLGKDINVLRNDQSGKFTFVMHGGSTEHVLAMMKLLWEGHTDRHGHADYTGVTAEEAQAAVLLASTLVGWFAKGMVTKAA
jgi:hypothetical protein